MQKTSKLILCATIGVMACNTAQAQTVVKEDFEHGVPGTWTLVDADKDGYNWGILYNQDGVAPIEGYESELCVSSGSYINGKGAVNPDNWLITPMFDLEGEGTLSYVVSAQQPSHPHEHYAVYASTTGKDTTDFKVCLHEETLEEGKMWKSHTFKLPTGTKYVAFRHFKCSNNFYINIDNVNISKGAPMEKYGLYVGGTQVTSNNAANVLNDGKVTYDATTSTLTLNNAEIVSNIANDHIKSQGICNVDVANLIIKLKGNSNVTSTHASGIMNSALCTMTICSDEKGMVTINGLQDALADECGINNRGTLFIKNCTADITGNYGLAGYSTEAVTFENATIKAKGCDDFGSIGYLGTLTLNNCKIVTPTGAIVETTDDGTGIYLNHNLVTEQVVIVPTSESTHVTNIAQDGKDMATDEWFDLQGRRINRPQEQGIYIHNHKKYVIR